MVTLPSIPKTLRVPLSGTLAAAVTPLGEDGRALDEEAFGRYVDFLVASKIDGLLALGTTGEGILLRSNERRRTVESFVDAADGRLQVAVHAGAQSTADTVGLAAHAAEAGAAAVAVIGPPYFALDDLALLAHFGSAARACEPLPFYVYEFERASGYAVPVAVLERLREQAPNFAGLKVSDTPFERFSSYLLDGLDVFVGPESLIQQGLAAGAIGAVSALAAVFPAEVAAVVRAPSEEGASFLGRLRADVERFPRHAALKHLLGRRGVPVREDVRKPLRQLTDDERTMLDSLLESSEVERESYAKALGS